MNEISILKEETPQRSLTPSSLLTSHSVLTKKRSAFFRRKYWEESEIYDSENWLQKNEGREFKSACELQSWEDTAL